MQELHFREDEEKVAYVKRVNVDYFTDAISAKGVWILQRFESREHPAYLTEQGEVLVAEKVVGFKKIKMGTLENVGSGEVELPQQEKQTTAYWLTVAPPRSPREPLARESSTVARVESPAYLSADLLSGDSATRLLARRHDPGA